MLKTRKALTICSAVACTLLMSSLLSASALAAAKTTITFLAGPRVGSNNENVVKMLVDDFNKSQSEIFVKYTPASGDWTDKVLSQVAAGVAPDIVQCWDNILRSYIDAGITADLTPYFTAKELDDFYPNQLAVFKLKGKLHGVPQYMGISCMYYNVDAYKSRGVAEPTSKWDWSDMLAAAQKTTIQTSTGKPSLYGYGLYQDWSRMYLWILENGGKIFDEGQILGTRCYLDQEPAIQAFSFQRDLIYKYGVAPKEQVSPWEAFAQGKVATFQSGSWDLSWITNNSKVKWGIMERPSGPKGHKASTLTTDAYIMSKACKNKLAAVKFIKYLIRPESEELMMRVADIPPARRSLANRYATESRAAKAGYSMKPFLDARPYASNTPMFQKNKRVYEILNPLIVDSVWGANADVTRNLKKLTSQIHAIHGIK